MIKVGDTVRIDRLYVVRQGTACKGPDYKVGSAHKVVKIEYGCKVSVEKASFPIFTWQVSKLGVDNE